MNFSRLSRYFYRLLFVVITLSVPFKAQALEAAPPNIKFRVVALAEAGNGNKDHTAFVEAAKIYLNSLAAEGQFSIDYISDTKPINDKFLKRYRLFIQLNYPPYMWTQTAQKAFQRYIIEGRGGWIGFHHAALLGDFDGYPMSPWFSNFMGGIRYTNYLPNFADATVNVEDRSHPATIGLPSSFVVEHEEWYTWDHSPRAKVHVLATVDESSYKPDTNIKMGGDHPVVWTNENYKARNIYIFMGHHPALFQNPQFAQLFRNSIFWAAGK
jgi:type 1 glutamine amidotransferase